jgi:hypothetical protein
VLDDPRGSPPPLSTGLSTGLRTADDPGMGPSVALVRAPLAPVVGREVAREALRAVVPASIVIAVAEVPRAVDEHGVAVGTPAHDAIAVVDPRLPRRS